ncbi:hypothetical protein A3741_14660, partial [Oleiphilus sp. HI0069]
MMTKERSGIFFILCLLLALLLTCNQDAEAAKKHGAMKNSLLPECQGMALPSVHCGRAPSYAEGKDKVYVVFSQNGHIYLSSSSDEGRSYTPPIAVNRRPEAIYDDGENRPKILLGKQQEIFISWTHKTPGRYSGDVRFARSLDGGQNFSEPITINNDKALIGHRFDAMLMDGTGRLYLFWIDKRDKKAARDRNQDYLGGSIYFTYSDDVGASFQPDKKWVDHSCECCRLALANDSNQDVAILWRHVFPGSIRDHAIAYVKDWKSMQNAHPAKAAIDNWVIEGCPHHGPDMSFDRDDRAHIVWFTQGDKHKGLVYGRYNFSEGRALDTISIDSLPGASRPQVIVQDSNVFLLWKRYNGQGLDLILRQSVNLGKDWLKEKVIASTTHDSDHPDLIEVKGRIH